MTRRIPALATLCAALGVLALGACRQTPPTKSADQTINFSILSAEDQQSMSSIWQPLLDDLQQQTGLEVKAFYGSNYTALIQAMRFNQVQAGWFSALPALEAVRRADGEVLGRVVDAGGEGVYQSILIVKKGSGITLDKVLKCEKRYTFGIGDAKSTSGTLAPMAYLFTPRGIEPTNCFRTVRSANHQANMFSVGNGVLDVATNNTVGLVFAKRQAPALAGNIEVIWTSPPLPESSIVVRKDLDPAVKEKMRSFFLNYGSAPGAEGERQRAVLKKLEYGGFRVADDSYLDPVREMEAVAALNEARKTGDPAKVAAARKAFDDLQAELAHKRAAKAGG